MAFLYSDNDGMTLEIAWHFFHSTWCHFLKCYYVILCYLFGFSVAEILGVGYKRVYLLNYKEKCKD